MKKVLIASTALVAATMVSAGAASASEKIKLDLGGYSKWYVVGAWQKSAYQRAANIQPVAVDVKGDNEVFFGGETTLNNGLKVGINIELEAGGNIDTRASSSYATDVIDKSSVFVEGGFGKVIIGTEANGAVLLHVMAPDAAGNWGSDGILTGGFSIAQPAAWSLGAIGVRTTTEIDTDDNAEKITYVSPSFYGFTVGGTYIPNALSEDNRGVEGVGTNNQLGTTTGAVPAYGVGALYANTYGDFGVKVSAGFVWYDLTRAGKAGTSDLGYHGDANHEWSAGTQLSYKGVTVGGSYRNITDEVNAAAGRNSFDGHVWDAGIAYATGPYAVSFSYLQSQYEGSTTIAKNDKEEVYQASGKYALGPGVDVLASGGYVKYTGETAAPDQNNKGWVVMSGLSLAF